MKEGISPGGSLVNTVWKLLLRNATDRFFVRVQFSSRVLEPVYAFWCWLASPNVGVQQLRLVSFSFNNVLCVLQFCRFTYFECMLLRFSIDLDHCLLFLMLAAMYLYHDVRFSSIALRTSGVAQVLWRISGSGNLIFARSMKWSILYIF